MDPIGADKVKVNKAHIHWFVVEIELWKWIDCNTTQNRSKLVSS